MIADGLLHATAGQMLGNQCIGILHGVCLDVDDDGYKARCLDHGQIIVHDFLATCGHQHVHFFRIGLRRSQYLKIEIHFVQRVRNITVGIQLDLAQALRVGEVRRHFDEFGDDVCRRYRHGGVLVTRARAPDGFLHRLRDLVHIGDLVFHHRILRQGFHGIMLDNILRAVAAQFEHFDGGRTNVDPD